VHRRAIPPSRCGRVTAAPLDAARERAHTRRFRTVANRLIPRGYRMGRWAALAPRRQRKRTVAEGRRRRRDPSRSNPRSTQIAGSVRVLAARVDRYQPLARSFCARGLRCARSVRFAYLGGGADRQIWRDEVRSVQQCRRPDNRCGATPEARAVPVGVRGGSRGGRTRGTRSVS